MGGWAALLGGVGAGAQQYGNQVRGFLEARRTNLADTLLNIATQEPDPQLRGEYLGHVSKLLSGEPMAKMIPAIGKTVQGHLEDNNTLAQILPPPSGQQQSYAGQAPVGMSPGLKVPEPQPPSAAMYPTSPVNPLVQQAQMPPIPMAPGQATPFPIPAAPVGQQPTMEPGRFDTQIPAARQSEYQAWKQQNAPGDSGYDYDLPGLFLSGQGTDARGHATDQFKKPNHPTFSTDSQYSGQAGEVGGRWIEQNGKTYFYASPTNLKYHSAGELQQYFRDREPDATLVLPPVSGGGAPQPWAYTPTPANIPGTTLPEGSAPQARMSAAPPINPSPADLEQNAPTGAPQSYVDRVLQHPYARTPAGRAFLQYPLQQAAEMDRQLGLSHEFVQQKMNYLPTLMAQVRQIYEDPATSPFMRSLLQSYVMEAQGWAVNPDINARFPTMPFTANTLLQTQKGRPQLVDVTDMSDSDRRLYNVPEGAKGSHWMSTDPLSNQIRPDGYVGPGPANMRPETAWDPRSRSFVPVAVDIAHPGNEPTPLTAGSPYQVLPPGMGGFTKGVTPDLRMAYTNPWMAATGAGGGQIQTNLVPPFAFPSEHPVMATVKGPGGTSQQVQIPSIARKLPLGAAGGGAQPAAAGGGGEQLGGAPVPPGLPPGTRYIGEKPQTPHQIMTNDQQLYQENKALGQIQYLKDHAQVFAGLIDAGKIELGLRDGLVQNILTRAIDYTPEQRAVVQAFNSLGESVGILRNALGGGFRSHDAFLRLQATKGSVMQNPQLTTQILDNLGGEFRGQAIPLARSMGGQVYGLKTLPPPGSLPAELQGAPQGQGSDLYQKLNDKYLKKK